MSDKPIGAQPDRGASSLNASAEERADAEFIDALYADRDRGGVDGLEELRRVRSLFAELKATQDEPPTRGMSVLLAAARQAAEERRPAGVWARLRAGWMALLAHPALSAASAAVLVLGVAGYLASRGMGRAALMTAPVAKEESPPAASPALSQESSPAAAEPRDLARPEPAAVAPTAPVEDVSPRRNAEKPAAKQRPAPIVAAKLENSGSDRQLEIATGDQDEASNEEPSGGDPASAAAAYGSSGAVDRNAGSPSPGTSALPAAPAPPSGTATAAAPSPAVNKPKPARGPSTAGKADSAPAKPPSSKAPEEVAAPRSQDESAGGTDAAGPKAGISRPAERWFTLAKDAASKGDCDAVKLFAQRVKKEDPAFYDSRFRKDPVLQKCL